MRRVVINHTSVSSLGSITYEKCPREDARGLSREYILRIPSVL